MSQYRFSRPKFSVALIHGASATSKDQALTINGLVSQVLIKTPTTVDGGATVSVTITDSDGYTIYSKTGVAASTRSVNLLAGDAKFPLSGTQTLTVTFSVAQTSTDTTTEVVLLIDKGA